MASDTVNVYTPMKLKQYVPWPQCLQPRLIRSRSRSGPKATIWWSETPALTESRQIICPGIHLNALAFFSDVIAEAVNFLKQPMTALDFIVKSSQGVSLNVIFSSAPRKACVSVLNWLMANCSGDGLAAFPSLHFTEYVQAKTSMRNPGSRFCWA